MKRPLMTMRHTTARHVTIWDGISDGGRDCTGRMKVIFC